MRVRLSINFVFRQGNYKEAIDNLKQFLKVTEENGDDESRRQACSDIGSVYNMMVQYIYNCLQKIFVLLKFWCSELSKQ